MELVLNTYGAHLGKVGERFLVSVGGEKREFATKTVEKILVTTAALISTDALKLAIENNIDVVFLENNGFPFGRVWHSKLGSITSIRRNQLKLTEDNRGTTLVKELISQKIQNQLDYLQRLKLNRSEDKVKTIEEARIIIESHLNDIKSIEEKPISEVRNIIEGHEGYSAKIYFQTLGKLIPDKYRFDGRSRNPALDGFNCMLNYAYGILYSRVEKSCIIAGLDPYIGIMHTDNYNKTALVFDLIETYRIYMDEVVFGLFSKRKIKENMFDAIEGQGFWLNKEGKQTLIEAINNRFEDKIKYKGRMIKIENIIQFDCHNLANKILKEVI